MSIKMIVIKECEECPFITFNFRNYQNYCKFNNKPLPDLITVSGNGKDIPEWCKLKNYEE